MVKPGYKQTEVGVIPEEWEVCAWEAAGSCFSSGATPCRAISRYFDGEIKWVSSGELNHNIIIDTLEHISKEAQEENNLVIHPANTFLMAITGLEAAGTRGSCAILGVPATTNQSCMAVYGTEKLDVKYLFYYYSAKGDDLAFKYCQGTKQQSYTAGIVKKLPIILPPIDEQKKIAAALSDVDKLINTLNRQYAKKKAIKQGAMQELLTGKKRLPGFIREWQHFIFGELFNFIPNNAFTRAQMSESGKVKNIHYGDILTKYGAYVNGSSDSIPYISKDVDLARFADRCYLQSGDIIMADTAEDETAGKVLEVVNVDCPILAGQHTLLCRPKVRFAPKFLGYYLNAACYHDQLIPYIVGTKVSSVSKASVAQTELVVPDYEEQQAIAEILSNMDSGIEALERKLAKYRQVKQGMMQQLLTGKIRLTKNEEGLE